MKKKINYKKKRVKTQQLRMFRDVEKTSNQKSCVCVCLCVCVCVLPLSARKGISQLSLFLSLAHQYGQKRQCS
jgi:hypothetical protein